MRQRDGSADQSGPDFQAGNAVPSGAMTSNRKPVERKTPDWAVGFICAREFTTTGDGVLPHHQAGPFCPRRFRSLDGPGSVDEKLPVFGLGDPVICVWVKLVSGPRDVSSRMLSERDQPLQATRIHLPRSAKMRTPAEELGAFVFRRALDVSGTNRASPRNRPILKDLKRRVVNRRH